MELKEIAERAMCIGIKESEILKNWDYRKGKNFNDVKAAITKGLRKGVGKFEREVEWIELYLGDVLKHKKKVTA
jgi:hypothetical protein